MNVILALGQRGYINAIDFDIFVVDGTINDLKVWKHTDPTPTQADIDVMWNEYLSANPVDINFVKDEAKNQVDQTAESARLRYVTPGSAQAMTYTEKAEEASVYITAGYPVDLTPFPFIQAEVNATGKANNQAADDIMAKKASWKIIGAQIEEKRIGGKVNIDASSDEAGIYSARDQAISDLDVI